MLHFKAPSFDREIFLLWTPRGGVSQFDTEKEAREHFAEEHRDGRPALVFRFNPSAPDETRDITEDCLSAIEEEEASEEAYDGFSPQHCERDRSALVSSVGQYTYEGNRRG